MDFSTRVRRMMRSLKGEIAETPEAAEFFKAAETAEETAEELYEMICAVNGSKQPEERESVAGAVILDAFKYCEDSFVALDWYEKSVFPHENAQKNIEYMQRAVAALEEGDADGAKCAMVEVDDNSYAEAFARGVTSYFTARALTDAGSWGSGRLTGHIDLFGVMRAVMEKSRDEQADFTFEKEELTVKIAVEKKNLRSLIEAETARLKKLTQKLQGAMIAVEALDR